MDLYGIIEDHLERGEKGALATIIRKLGAAPRGTGAKMFVTEKGASFGTIGGGKVELEMVQEAATVVRTGRPKIIEYRMDSLTVEAAGMICGGNVDVLVEPVTEEQKEFYTAVAELERQAKPGLIVTNVSETRFEKTVLAEGRKIAGDAADDEISERFSEYLNRKQPSFRGEKIIEPILFSPTVYIFGAGHISLFLSKIAAMVDFSVTVVDDRPEFANVERFPEADRVVVEPFNEVFDRLDFQGKDYVVIVTRGHAWDAAVLEEAMKRPARYVGMIGSRRKTGIIMEHLKAKGIDPQRLATVHSPIGVDISAETPEEIAVAIVAEMISVRRGS
jgi:xanthine dehydrogenase accessory factor